MYLKRISVHKNMHTDFVMSNVGAAVVKYIFQFWKWHAYICNTWYNNYGRVVWRPTAMWYYHVDSNQIAFGATVKRVTVMIPTVTQVLLKDWATLPSAYAQNVWLCRILLNAFVTVGYQRLRNTWKAVMDALHHAFSIHLFACYFILARVTFPEFELSINVSLTPPTSWLLTFSM